MYLQERLDSVKAVFRAVRNITHCWVSLGRARRAYVRARVVTQRAKCGASIVEYFSPLLLMSYLTSRKMHSHVVVVRIHGDKGALSKITMIVETMRILSNPLRITQSTGFGAQDTVQLPAYVL